MIPGRAGRRTGGTVKALSVVSRNGSELFRHQRPSLDSIGRVLKVGTLVDGRVAVADKRVRVTVSMIDAKGGSQFDSEVFNSELADIFDLQDSLSVQVADFLRQKVGQEMGKIELRRTTHNVKAWELLQRASLAGERAADRGEHRRPGLPPPHLPARTRVPGRAAPRRCVL
jgi:adenylate cyclase